MFEAMLETLAGTGGRVKVVGQSCLNIEFAVCRAGWRVERTRDAFDINCS